VDIKDLLKNKFGYLEFKPGQEVVIQDVILGKDTIAILPTGSGKSLCYQLPAYALEGMVLIISPLVALMEDQVAIMKQHGEKRVVALNSFLSFSERNQIIANLKNYKFVFISPEMLLQPIVSVELKSIKLALIVVDEAHCISQWGFDFRPEYLRIGEFLRQIDRPNLLALTATANGQVIDEIKKYLILENPIIHRSSLDRPNISYGISRLPSISAKTEWICDRVKKTSGPGIIYVSSRKRSDELAAELTAKGNSVSSYHAGMEQEDRAFIQQQFLIGEIEWICATNAFGMGIHKSNIRQIIHEHIPSTVAGYMQEVGRAGRDDKLSVTTLLYSGDDERKTRFIIQGDIPAEEEIRVFSQLVTDLVPKSEAAQLAGLSETGKRVTEFYLERMSLEETVLRIQEQRLKKERQLQRMLEVVNGDKCIRVALLDYFDEELSRHPESCCSVCGTINEEWLVNEKPNNIIRHLTNWSDRLAQILG